MIIYEQQKGDIQYIPRNTGLFSNFTVCCNFGNCGQSCCFTAANAYDTYLVRICNLTNYRPTYYCFNYGGTEPNKGLILQQPYGYQSSWFTTLIHSNYKIFQISDEFIIYNCLTSRGCGSAATKFAMWLWDGSTISSCPFLHSNYNLGTGGCCFFDQKMILCLNRASCCLTIASTTYSCTISLCGLNLNNLSLVYETGQNCGNGAYTTYYEYGSGNWKNNNLIYKNTILR